MHKLNNKYSHPKKAKITPKLKFKEFPKIIKIPKYQNKMTYYLMIVTRIEDLVVNVVDRCV